MSSSMSGVDGRERSVMKLKGALCGSGEMSIVSGT
jgi:hypothetical protein